MIFKLFSPRFYPVIPLWNHPKSLLNDLQTHLDLIALEKIDVDGSFFYVKKGKDTNKNPKKEDLTVKMPGFVKPETRNEEGYFTQKAKHQIEELKKRGLEKPSLSNPEKKE